MRKIYIIYDDMCPVCVRAMRWLEKRDRKGVLTFVPLSTANLEEQFPTLKRSECEKMVHVLSEDGRVFTGEAGILFVLKHLGWYGKAGAVLDRPYLRPIWRALYRWFSKHRYQVAEVFRAKKEKAS